MDRTVVGITTTVIACAILILLASNATAQQPDGPPVFEQQLLAGDPADDDNFGTNVAIDGDTAVVGAYLADFGTLSHQVNTGAAYVFVRSAGVWTEQAKLEPPEADHEFDLSFGYSVGISGDTIVVGAYHYFNYTGVAYVFVRSGGVWSLQQRLTASDPTPSDNFGFATAIDGESIIISAYDPSGSGTGSAFVFTRSGTVWTQQQQLFSPDPSVLHRFGFAVAISGDTVVVGDHTHPPDGAAYVFTRTAGVWTPEQSLAPVDLDAEGFGWPLALDGDTLAVTDRLGDVDTVVDAGAVYVFVRTGTLWTQEERLTAHDAGQEAKFGQGVDLQGDTIVAGSLLADHGGLVDAGAAYVFRRSAGVWTDAVKLIASDASAEDHYGLWVGLDDGTAVIGARWVDHSGVTNAGVAYVYLVDNIFLFADGFESGDTDGWSAISP